MNLSSRVALLGANGAGKTTASAKQLNISFLLSRFFNFIPAHNFHLR
jgi:hypothetical protein